MALRTKNKSTDTKADDNYSDDASQWDNPSEWSEPVPAPVDAAELVVEDSDLDDWSMERSSKPNPLLPFVQASNDEQRGKAIPVANDDPDGDEVKQVKNQLHRAAQTVGCGLRIKVKDGKVHFIAKPKRTINYTTKDVRAYFGLGADEKPTQEQRKQYREAHGL